METDSRDLMERRHEAKRQLTPWVLPRHLQTHAELLPSVNRQKITTCVLHYTTMTNRSCSHLQTHAELLPSVNRQNNHLHPHNTTMTNHSCSHLQTHAELLPPVNRHKNNHLHPSFHHNDQHSCSQLQQNSGGKSLHLPATVLPLKFDWYTQLRNRTRPRALMQNQHTR